MATIVSTELKVYAGTTASGSQIGNTITDLTSGGPTHINIDYAHLGAYLSPGEQYCAVVRCTNDEAYTTSWVPDPPYPFKTHILPEIVTVSNGCGRLYVDMSYTYNPQVITNRECGVYVSTNASGANAQRIATNNEQETTQSWELTGLLEHQDYYLIPFVVDDIGEWAPQWSEAEGPINTLYKAPTFTFPSEPTTTYNSISVSFNVSTNDTLSSVYVTLQPTGGGAAYRINRTATTGNHSFTITNGQTDDSNPSQTIVINPSTEYRIRFYAVNTSGCTGNDQKTVTTSSQATETITITSISNIEPTSARANLSYGNGGAVVNPNQQQ